MRALLLLALVLPLSQPADAQRKRPPPPCASAEHRQFDFWLGDWQVFDKTGVVQRERITWTPNADGSVRQFWESSSDDGKRWTTAFDGLYKHPNSG
ncbi:hypothetical protein BH11PSE14_BH11PSE14_24070 [soil metagenome]